MPNTSKKCLLTVPRNRKHVMSDWVTEGNTRVSQEAGGERKKAQTEPCLYVHGKEKKAGWQGLASVGWDDFSRLQHVGIPIVFLVPGPGMMNTKEYFLLE
jgi:hypothetical protein